MEPVGPNQPGPAEADARVARLERDLASAVEHQRATSDILETIGRSAFDLEPVFETVLRHAVRLCARGRRDGVAARRPRLPPRERDGRVRRVPRLLHANPIARGPGTLVGLVGLERRTVQIEDAYTDPRYEWQAALDLGRFHTLLGVPMLTGGRVVGVVVLSRTDVDPFGDETIELVTTFAAQGAIAISNVHLFRELQERGAELARSVDELRALGEISQAVSSSLDAARGPHDDRRPRRRALGGRRRSIFEYEPGRGEFALRTCFGTSAELAEAFREIPISLDETFIGPGGIGRRGAPGAGARGGARPTRTSTRSAATAGARSSPSRCAAATTSSASSTVRRKTPGAFADEAVRLLETLAGQSATAIHNAGLFRELEHKSRELEVASRHKSEFLASMSHELRTPLNAVIGFSDVLLDRMFGELTERQEEYVRDIGDSGRHLLELINEILDLSKIEAGRMEVDLAPVSLPDLLEHGVAMVRERAARQGVSLALDVAPEVGIVHADELKLKQVVLNLLTNAVKFTPAGRLGRARPPGRRRRLAVVTVRDTGSGIPEAEHEASSRPSSAAAAARARRPRAPASGSRCRGGSSTCTAAGCGWRARSARAARSRSRSRRSRRWRPRRPARRGRSGGREAAAPAASSSSRTTAGRPTCYRVFLEGAGHTVVVARDGVEGLELARAARPRRDRPRRPPAAARRVGAAGTS